MSASAKERIRLFQDHSKISGRHQLKSKLEVGNVKDYVNRPLDVLNAVRSLGRSGFSVSLPDRAADGEMFFKIAGYELTVAQLLELMDRNRLDLVSIRYFAAKRDERPWA